MPDIVNLLQNLNPPTEGEHFEHLLRCQNVLIERIVSSGSVEVAISDERQDEWVTLLSGKACLQIDDEQVRLAAGDSLFIPAHTRHAVLETSSDPVCVWLAVHIFAKVGTG